MVKGTTTSGFNFEIDERLAEDYRFLSSLLIADDEKETDFKRLKACFDICEFVLGDNKEAFIEHIKANNEGYVPFSAVKDEIAEIISESKSLKN